VPRGVETRLASTGVVERLAAVVPSRVSSTGGIVQRVLSREGKLLRGVCTRVPCNSAELGTAGTVELSACPCASKQGAVTEWIGLCPTERNATSAASPAFRTATCAAIATGSMRIASGTAEGCVCCCCCCCSGCLAVFTFSWTCGCGGCTSDCTAAAWTCDGCCRGDCRIQEFPGRIVTMTLPTICGSLRALTLVDRSRCWSSREGTTGDAGAARPKPRRGCRTAVTSPIVAGAPVGHQTGADRNLCGPALLTRHAAPMLVEEVRL